MSSNDGSGAPTTGEMLFANDQAALAAASVAVSKPAAPDLVIPTLPSDAAARLNELRGDPTWLNEYFGGSVRHAKEMRDLRAVIDKGGNPEVDRAIAGVLDDAPIQTSKRMTMIGTAAMLREGGISDTGVIRQVLAGDSVTPQEHAAASETKARLMNDQAFVARYTAGDGEAKRQMTLLNVIISSSIKVAAA
ncbi:hypothetical protein [Bradyrhizobium sp. UNPA324]|uniref:hypothetical protein n=1 Tax=Bradyrhizobium sp. UNPA324 TaxID=1141174 RepID=UPI00115077C7|nr:hypothetical protein [Bradyrhizobium sp. UNPA324]TQF28784.1 hypothetical protein UNPA324_03300 [Bradyrhizobium sp. UNPA324]